MTTVVALLNNDFFVVEGDDDREEFDRNFTLLFVLLLFLAEDEQQNWTTEEEEEANMVSLSASFLREVRASKNCLKRTFTRSKKRLFSGEIVLTDRFSSDESDFFE